MATGGKRVHHLFEVQRVRADDEGRVQLDFSQHFAVIAELGRLLVEWHKDIVLVTRQHFFAGVSQRSDLYLGYRGGENLPVMATHATTANNADANLGHFSP